MRAARMPPMTAPARTPAMMKPKDWTSAPMRVAPMAIAIPTMPYRLPRRAVDGWVSPLRAKMKRMAEQLARLEAGRVKEVAGTAAIPQEEEDVPLPEDDVPKPEDYSQAKEMLRRNLEHDEIARKVRQEEEAEVEQFAKEHMVWLYEIYKMGGMSREDFIQKAAAKYSESKSDSPPGAAASGAELPPNPALANLGKEIEKKEKK